MNATPLVWRTALPLLAGAAIALTPAPAGLAGYAWHYFAAFVVVILLLITEPLPAAAIGLIGVTAMAMLRLPFSPGQLADPDFRVPAETLKWTLAGFANGTVWLIFAAFIVAMGYEKTRLGRRIALFLVRHLGRRTLGLGYAIALSDLALAAFTPSNTARSAGTIFPIIRNIPELYGSRPDDGPRRIGAYLMWVAFATTCVTSSMFVTALAPNLLALEMVKTHTGIDITWTDWLVGFLPVGLVLLLLLPYVVYKLYPPEIVASAEVPQWAARELRQMGRRHETRSDDGVPDPGGSDPLDCRSVRYRSHDGRPCRDLADARHRRCLVGRRRRQPTGLERALLVCDTRGPGRRPEQGRICRLVREDVRFPSAGYPPQVVMLSLVALFFFVHYMFASLTAHTTAVLPVILAAGVVVPGMPIRMFVLLLGFSLGIMGVITPYATGPAPVYFASGFIARLDFWRLGLIFGLMFLGTLLLIGVPWLLLLGV